MTLAELAAEITNDPAALGYAAPRAAGNDQGVADLLNVVRQTIDVKRADITTAELYAAISVTDYTALPGNPNTGQLSTERRYLAWLTGLVALTSVRLQNDDGSNTPVADNLSAMFGAGTPTRARIVALMTRKGSRAEQLWGAGTVISPTQVAQSLGRV